MFQAREFPIPRVHVKCKIKNRRVGGVQQSSARQELMWMWSDGDGDVIEDQENDITPGFANCSDGSKVPSIRTTPMFIWHTTI